MKEHYGYNLFRLISNPFEDREWSTIYETVQGSFFWNIYGMQEPEDFHCAECNCTSFSFIDERQSDGSFAPSEMRRCHNCKLEQ